MFLTGLSFCIRTPCASAEPSCSEPPFRCSAVGESSAGSSSAPPLVLSALLGPVAMHVLFHPTCPRKRLVRTTGSEATTKSSIGALLIPIGFITLCVNQGIMPVQGPTQRVRPQNTLYCCRAGLSGPDPAGPGTPFLSPGPGKPTQKVDSPL